MIIFDNFEHSSLSTSIVKQNKNNWARNYMLHSYDFVQFQHKPLLNLPKSLGKRTQTPKNTWNWASFVRLSTSACQLRSQSKLKNHLAWKQCDTLIFSCNCNISYSLTCPKAWQKGFKQPKIAENDHSS